jgi:hypothetical protein
MTKITLPGSIPGLLRRGSPVFYTKEETYFDNDWKCAVVEKHDLCSGVGGPGGQFTPDDTDLVLDLEDPTGRQHAVWWLAKHFRMSVIHAWFDQPDIECQEWRLESRYGYTYLVEFIPEQGDNLEQDGSEIHKYCVVPTLKEEDIPDAEALRRICLHVAGL